MDVQPSPPFRLAEALSKIDSASAKIAMIRKNGDALLDILVSLSSPNFQERSFEKSILSIGSNVKESLQQLRTVGKEIESYGALGNQSCFDSEKRLVHPLPLDSLVHPDGTTLQYAWKNLIINQSLARSAECSNNALKSFSESRTKTFASKRTWPQISDRKKTKKSSAPVVSDSKIFNVETETNIESNSKNVVLTNTKTNVRYSDEKTSDAYFVQLLDVIENVSSIRSSMKFDLLDQNFQIIDLKSKLIELNSKKSHDGENDDDNNNDGDDDDDPFDSAKEMNSVNKNGDDVDYNDKKSDDIKQRRDMLMDKNGKDVDKVRENLKFKNGMIPSVLIVTLPKVTKAILSLATFECVCVKSAAVFGDNEIGSHVHAYGVSNNHTFSKLSIYVNNALHYFQKMLPQNSLQPFLIWFSSYISLFKEKCRVCDKILAMDPSSRILFPPLLRPFNEQSFPLHFWNDQTSIFHLPKLENISKYAYHVECFPNLVS